MSVFSIDNSFQQYSNGYDSLMYWPALQEYYCHSDFVNFGYWNKNTLNAKEASENLMEKLLTFIPEKRDTILDVACGKGATTSYLTKYYMPSNITGINISEKQLETCRKNAPECRFLLMDATDLQFADSSFDNIICVEAAFHFNTREKFLKDAFRVLNPGGYLVLSDILLTKEAEARRRYRTVKNFVENLQEYEDLCLGSGFKEIKVIDATKPCIHGAFWHLVQFSHEKLLSRKMDADSLRAFVKHIFEFVPEFRYYLLASAKKGYNVIL